VVIKGLYTIRLNSSRVPLKNIKLLGGRPLLNYALSTLNKVERIQDIILYSSSDLSEYIEDGLEYRWIQRPARLDGDEIQLRDIAQEIFPQIESDYIVMSQSTSPFITPETINELIDGIERGHDSAFTVVKHSRNAWYKWNPLNHSLSSVQRTQELEPVFIEGGVFVINKDYYLRTGRRIGNKPYIKEIDILEGWDIDTPQEWRIAECISSFTQTAPSTT